MVSPKSTAPQATAGLLPANFLNNSKTAQILTACSKIWVRALGVTLLSAMKYPLTQEETPIKGRENAIILRAGSALISPIIQREINLAPKNTRQRETIATIRVNSTERRKMRTVPFLEPKASSSVTRRVTAVLIPAVAKVEASI